MPHAATTIILLALLVLSTYPSPYAFEAVGPASTGGYTTLQQSAFAQVQRAVGIAWTGSYFVGSDRADLNSARLVRISSDGKTVTPFAPSFSTTNGSMEDYIAISQGNAGFLKDYLFVISFDSIYEIDPTGNKVTLFSTPMASEQLSYLAFDTVGTWGNLLYVVAQDGIVWSIDSSGKATEVVNLGTGQNLESVTVAPLNFGSFGGNLIISEEVGQRGIVAISQNTRSQTTMLAQFPGEAPERVIPIQNGSDMLLGKYDQGVFQRYPASNFSNFTSSGALLMISEGESGQNGSMNVLAASGTHITVTKIFLENNPHFEGAIFVPSSAISAPESTTTTASQISSISATNSLTITGALVVLVVVIVASGALIALRRSRMRRM